MPEGHTLNRLLTMASKRLGLVIRSRLVREGGEVYRALFFDVNRSRMIRELSSAHYERMTSSTLPGSDVESDADRDARHVAELDEAIERDAVIARHGIESDIEADPVIGRGAGGHVRPDTVQIDRLIVLMAHFWSVSGLAQSRPIRASA